MIFGGTKLKTASPNFPLVLLRKWLTTPTQCAETLKKITTDTPMTDTGPMLPLLPNKQYVYINPNVSH